MSGIFGYLPDILTEEIGISETFSLRMNRKHPQDIILDATLIPQKSLCRWRNSTQLPHKYILYDIIHFIFEL
jgi:hypothetical protein